MVAEGFISQLELNRRRFKAQSRKNCAAVNHCVAMSGKKVIRNGDIQYERSISNRLFIEKVMINL